MLIYLPLVPSGDADWCSTRKFYITLHSMLSFHNYPLTRRINDRTRPSSPWRKKAKKSSAWVKPSHLTKLPLSHWTEAHPWSLISTFTLIGPAKVWGSHLERPASIDLRWANTDVKAQSSSCHISSLSTVFGRWLESWCSRFLLWCDIWYVVSSSCSVFQFCLLATRAPPS